jgi:hypothetical protein
VERLLKKIGDGKRGLSGAFLSDLQAVEVLEHIGTPDARQLLMTLAGGALQARLTREGTSFLAAAGKVIAYELRRLPLSAHPEKRSDSLNQRRLDPSSGWALSR